MTCRADNCREVLLPSLYDGEIILKCPSCNCKQYEIPDIVFELDVEDIEDCFNYYKKEAKMYPYTISKIREQEDIIRSTIETPGLKPDEKLSYEHIEYMCNEIEKMTDRDKASRWIGYLLRMMEQLEIWDNDYSRGMIRIDLKKGG